MKQIIVFAGVAVFSVASQAQQLFYEPFSYLDGALTNVAAGTWNWHSGSGGALTLNVVSGQAFIDQGDTSSGRDDYNRLLGTTFDPATDNTTKLYAGFSVRFTALPVNAGTSINGSYFAHFKSSAPNEFYSRIGASAGVTANTLRVAVGNESGFSSAAPTYFAQDLNLNTTYLVVARLDLATDQTTLWIDPLSESSTSVTATDGITYSVGAINAYALRQGTSGSSPNFGAPGDLYIDSLRVGTSFASVIPEPSSIALLVLGGLLLLRRRQ